MRIIGFSRMWSKLQKNEFTTFRFRKDLEIGEFVQVFYKPRSAKHKAFLFHAEVIGLEDIWANLITDNDAYEDGFDDSFDTATENMMQFMVSFYGKEKLKREPLTKITLKKVSHVTDNTLFLHTT